jgi:hypothetical protein
MTIYSGQWTLTAINLDDLRNIDFSYQCFLIFKHKGDWGTKTSRENVYRDMCAFLSFFLWFYGAPTQFRSNRKDDFG